MSTGIVLLGAGGHGRVVVDVLSALGTSRKILMLDDNPAVWGRGEDGVRTAGPIASLRQLIDASLTEGFVAIGANQARARLFRDLVQAGLSSPVLAHPSAVISPRAHLGSGVLVCAGAIIGPGARIGIGTIVNTGAQVDHDCEVGEFVHLAPGSVLCGEVSVASGALVGARATIAPGVSVGSRSIVGLGAAVVRAVPPNVTVAGVPARELRGRSLEGIR
jgi:sugar O-acyltransferase (sialic acid O-acetyltransferase NeuD family)